MGRPAIQFVGLFCAEARRGFDSGGCELPLFGYCFKECVWILFQRVCLEKDK